MELDQSVLTGGEVAAFKLRSLYRQYGYMPYKMSKFEEYELYALNKDFLASDSIITFNDADGKLMALKPDVTLSIVKNSEEIPGLLQKVYYDEQVYRTAGTLNAIREIRQAGVECIGEIDTYHSCEVLLLAARSLYSISKSYILDVSHMGFVAGLLECIDISESCKRELLDCIRGKNRHGIEVICGAAGLADDMLERLLTLVQAYGPMERVLDELRPVILNEAMSSSFTELEQVCSVLKNLGYDRNVMFDFSVASSMRYYNGLLFTGYIDGIPSGVLSGGRYDKLMHKMGKKSGAIGFAVYLDLLEGLLSQNNGYDVDILLLYSDDARVETLNRAAQDFVSRGLTVRVEKAVPKELRFRRLFRLSGNEVTELGSDR